MEESESIEGTDPQKQHENWERPLADVFWQGKTPPIDPVTGMPLLTGAQRLALLGQQQRAGDFGGSMNQQGYGMQFIRCEPLNYSQLPGSIQWSTPRKERWHSPGWMVASVSFVGVLLVLAAVGALLL